VQRGGSEAVVEALCAVVPDATLFTLFDQRTPALRDGLRIPAARTTFLQRLPGIARWYRAAAPVMPLAVRSLDLRAFDLIISSHHAVAKGVRTRAGQRHLCYIHTPMRYAWDQRERYLAEHGVRGLRAAVARPLLEQLRRFDLRTAQQVDRFVANSANVASRVERWYGRPSDVVPPPVDTEFFTPGGTRRARHFVTASRFVPYKQIPLIVAAFAELPDCTLDVIGDGPEQAAVAAAAAGLPNVRLRGALFREDLRTAMREATAFIFAADEDAGIVPVEAQACGTPVIAFAAGGSLETVTPETGVFFNAQTPSSIADAVRTALTRTFDAARCRAHAEQFSRARFDARLGAIIAEEIAALSLGGAR
jgi:glycosyltransferase involved in cell wall biosynthesis